MDNEFNITEDEINNCNELHIYCSDSKDEILRGNRHKLIVLRTKLPANILIELLSTGN